MAKLLKVEVLLKQAPALPVNPNPGELAHRLRDFFEEEWFEVETLSVREVDPQFGGV